MSSPRIFVVGCPRSGTTLLQSFFAAHPAVVSFPETHFFCRIHLRRRLGVDLADLGAAYARAERFLRAVDRLDLLPLMPASRRDDPAGRRRGRARGVIRAFASILDRIAEDAGTSTWAEKTPMHLRVHEPITRLLGRPVRFVHIVRDGRDAAASLYQAANTRPKAWGGTKTALECAGRWAQDVERTRQALDTEGHTVVFYEDLVARPEAEVRRLCDFVGLSFDRSMVECRAEAASRLITEYERTWHKGSFPDAVKPPDQRKFETVFTEADRDLVASCVDAVDLTPLRLCAA